MRIAVASDLHLEFKTLSLQNTDNADVLVLAGDISLAVFLGEPQDQFEKICAEEFRLFLKECSERFKHVVYVAGNHEYYQGIFPDTNRWLRAECEIYPNLHFLEMDTVTIEGVVFIGGTLWTDMNKSDPLTLYHAGRNMHDYDVIAYDCPSLYKFLPKHSVEWHEKTVQYLQQISRENKENTCVVVTHHAPSALSIHEKYRGSPLNGAYHSDLSDIILDNPQIKLWIHGHVHENIDYEIGSTRVVCNPRGYSGIEARVSSFKLRYLDI